MGFLLGSLCNNSLKTIVALTNWNFDFARTTNRLKKVNQSIIIIIVYYAIRQQHIQIYTVKYNKSTTKNHHQRLLTFVIVSIIKAFLITVYYYYACLCLDLQNIGGLQHGPLQYCHLDVRCPPKMTVHHNGSPMHATTAHKHIGKYSVDTSVRQSRPQNCCCMSLQEKQWMIIYWTVISVESIISISLWIHNHRQQDHAIIYASILHADNHAVLINLRIQNIAYIPLTSRQTSASIESTMSNVCEPM